MPPLRPLIGSTILPAMATPPSTIDRLVRSVAALALVLVGALASPAAASPAAVPASESWVHRSTNHGYHLTLPSASWREPAGKPRGSDAFFENAIPDMHVSVMLVKPEQSADDLAKEAAHLRSSLERSPERRASVRSRDGTNARGNRFHYFTALEPTPSGARVFIGNSVTWNPRTHLLVVVLFEGLQKAKSESDRAAELATFQKASDAICLSVE